MTKFALVALSSQLELAETGKTHRIITKVYNKSINNSLSSLIIIIIILVQLLPLVSSDTVSIIVTKLFYIR